MHPNFTENKYLYLAFSETDPLNKRLNTLRVVRGKLEGLALKEVKTIFKANPSRKTSNHLTIKYISV